MAAGNTRKASETAVQFVLHHPAVTSAVLGIRTEQQLEDALSAAQAAPLTDAEVQQLQAVLEAGKYEQHL